MSQRGQPAISVGMPPCPHCKRPGLVSEGEEVWIAGCLEPGCPGANPVESFGLNLCKEKWAAYVKKHTPYHKAFASLAKVEQWLHVNCSACKRPISGCCTDSTCETKGAMCGIRAIAKLIEDTKAKNVGLSTSAAPKKVDTPGRKVASRTQYPLIVNLDKDQDHA